MTFRELPAAIIGELGEVAGAALMRADGASIIALCRIESGGAPVLERGTTISPASGLVLPDFQAFNWRGQSACFVEIKTYAEAAHNKRFGLRVHGIPVRLFDHYRNIEKETGLRVVLGVNELDTGELRLSERSITELTPFPCLCRGRCRSVVAKAHIASARGIQEMQWYFDRDEFPIVYKHNGKTITRLREEHSKRIRRGHIWQRHGAELVIEPNPLASPGTPAPCQQCGATTDAADCLFSVGALDDAADRCVLCGACWHLGVQPPPASADR